MGNTIMEVKEYKIGENIMKDVFKSNGIQVLWYYQRR